MNYTPEPKKRLLYGLQNDKLCLFILLDFAACGNRKALRLRAKGVPPVNDRVRMSQTTKQVPYDAIVSRRHPTHHYTSSTQGEWQIPILGSVWSSTASDTDQY